MIGKVISSLLNDNAALLALVPTTSIYPYVINSDTALPTIVYSIDAIESEYTKDGWATDTITFSVMSLDKDYANLQDIVAQVRIALEWISDTIEGITFWNIMLTGLLEGFNLEEDTFINKLTFEVEIQSYS